MKNLIGKSPWLKPSRDRFRHIDSWRDRAGYGIVCNDFLRRKFDLPQDVKRIRLMLYRRPTKHSASVRLRRREVDTVSYFVDLFARAGHMLLDHNVQSGTYHLEVEYR